MRDRVRVLGSSSEIVQKLLLDRFGLRVEPMMGDYVARRLSTPTREQFAVMGGDARTGVPLRLLIDPVKLTATRSITSPPADRTLPAAPPASPPPSLFS